MMLILCDCGWDIPGVEKLPYHSHFRKFRVRRLQDGFEMTCTNFIEQDGYEVLEAHDGIHISVDWKALYRRIGKGATPARVTLLRAPRQRHNSSSP